MYESTGHVEESDREGIIAKRLMNVWIYEDGVQLNYLRELGNMAKDTGFSLDRLKIFFHRIVTSNICDLFMKKPGLHIDLFVDAKDGETAKKLVRCRLQKMSFHHASIREFDRIAKLIRVSEEELRDFLRKTLIEIAHDTFNVEGQGGTATGSVKG
ncbi:MAG: hypothetical protein Q7S28_00205 [bacterium]|nr:hypothetical protein [bacterium]